MLSSEQYAANLRSARNLAAYRVGWSGPTASIPYAQKDGYLKELARIILANPDRFDAQSVSNARRELSLGPRPGLDTFTAADAAKTFAAELGNQALSVGESVASVGEGAKAALNLAKFAIPVAAVVLLYFALSGARRRLA